MSAVDPDRLCETEGTPDEFERRVTEALAGSRWRGDEAALMRRLQEPARPARPRRVWALRAGIACAATLVVAAAAWSLLARTAPTSWRLDSGDSVRRGQWITTSQSDTAELSSSIGRVTVGPDSRVRMVRADEHEHRLELAEGSIEAMIFAPPRLFLVDTPAATAVDMGCAYKLDIAPDGSGLLRVTGGWVELQAGPVATRVPAGADCHLGPGGRLGLPRFEDASPEFAAALDRLEQNDGSALDDVLAGARVRDSLTLWHLLPRTDGDARRRVSARLAELAPEDPAVVSGATALEPAALDAWWSRLRLGW